MKQLKVIFVTNIISPYLVPLFNYIAQHGSFKFRVISIAENEANRQWRIRTENIRFSYSILPGFHWFIWSKELPIHINQGVWRYFLKEGPDIVITSGWSCLAYWEAFLYCKLFKKKNILWNGTTLLSVRKPTGLLARLKRFMIKGADLSITYGTKAAEFLEYMGASRDQVHVGVNTVDMEWFSRRVGDIRHSDDIQERRLKYPKFLILYVGQLVARKGILQVLRALEEISDPSIGFMIVGSGPQEKELRHFCSDRGIKKNVFFEDFQQMTVLPEYYALADVLILPSFKEVWGLVVNEALASGLYVLCSNRAGAAYDLIQPGWNGVLFDPNDIYEITSAIRHAREKVEDIRMRCGDISGHAVKKFSIAKAGEVFLSAIHSLKNQ